MWFRQMEDIIAAKNCHTVVAFRTSLCDPYAAVKASPQQSDLSPPLNSYLHDFTRFVYRRGTVLNVVREIVEQSIVDLDPV
jgi:hypothetical protein